ncbi:MAG: hypothetical protein ACKN87_15315, partial [Microcystis aeruginosa]
STGRHFLRKKSLKALSNKLFRFIQPALPAAASDFCQSTQWGFFQGNYLLKFALNGDFFLNPAAD